MFGFVHTDDIRREAGVVPLSTGTLLDAMMTKACASSFEVFERWLARSPLA
jgi:hypothetical protein